MKAFLIGLVIGYLIGGTAAWIESKYNWRNEANKRGFAGYYLDENNQRQWSWKDNK